MGNLLLSVLGLLVIFLLLFFVIDWYLKHESKASSPKKTNKETPNNANTENKTIPPEPKTPVNQEVTIYNSHLADDLDAALKQRTVIEDPTRSPMSQQTQRGRIAQYIANKNYHAFDFGTNEALTETKNEDDFTLEDYKRIVALSNINDKK